MCWICGKTLGAFKAFVIGPMCAINRTSSEPPAHRDCAIFAAKSCPFLVRPHAKRREDGLPDTAVDADGVPLGRNPGVALVWITKRYRIIADGKGGYVLSVGDPEETAWFREGRPATRPEVEESVRLGFPALLELAKQGGPSDVSELIEARVVAETLYPSDLA